MSGESATEEPDDAHAGMVELIDKVRRYVAPRQWAVDANDGVIATAGLLEGFAGAGATDRTLLMAATVMIIAGSLSLGGSVWAEAAGEFDAEHRIIEEELAQLKNSPDQEVAELAAYWESKGLSADLARRVADEMSARDALSAQLEYEHHIEVPTPPWRPVWAGLTSGLAFLCGSLIPLLITIFVPAQVEVWVILLSVALSLILVSFLAARTAHMSVGRTVARTLSVGMATLGLSYLAGFLLF